MSFCDYLSKEKLASYGCFENAKTTAIYRDRWGCHFLDARITDLDRKSGDSDGFTISNTNYGDTDLTLDATCVKGGGDFGNGTFNVTSSGGGEGI